MEITEVRIFLKDGTDKKLKAYATVTFDNAFVVRNIKVIEGQKGLFVAMPSRKLKESCPKCNFKNVVRSKFCNNCGASLPMTERKPVIQTSDPSQRESEHRDIAHPITLECREYLQKKVLEAYEADAKTGGATVAPSVKPDAATEEKPTPPSSIREEKKNMEGDLEF
ncbi:MAG: septation protein SpoVG family protein [Candidatus Omnitrophica bacterium]|nr:septation protein SpoVG family protein [Candidatus Omnitrophota bacterium]